MTAPIVISYQNWLKSKSYSEATIRNYLADLKKYFLFTDSNLDQVTDKIFDQDNLSSYFQNINQDSNYKRFLASLSKFFQFALDQHLISNNPFPKALKSISEPLCPPIEDIIKQYQQQLETKKFSLSTIKNYINDIHQFINWAQNESRPVKGDVTK
ncbi:MAG: site-specific integrase [Candidatus Shapirobacteria bacterium]|jgi:site-specific recombinase XerD